MATRSMATDRFDVTGGLCGKPPFPATPYGTIALMTTPSDKTPEVLEAISTLQQSLDGLEAQVDAQNLFVQSLTKAQEASAAAHKALAEGIDDLNPRMDGLTAKVDGLTDDIAEVKGGHARNAMLRSAPLVADALDCQLIAEVPQGVLLGFAKIAEAYDEPHNDVQSFKNADMVLHVMNPGQSAGLYRGRGIVHCRQPRCHQGSEKRLLPADIHGTPFVPRSRGR